MDCDEVPTMVAQHKGTCAIHKVTCENMASMYNVEIMIKTLWLTALLYSTYSVAKCCWVFSVSWQGIV